MNPQALAFSTTFNAFKNNDYRSGSVSVSGTIAAGGSASFSTVIPLEREESVAQIYITPTRTAGELLFENGRNYMIPRAITYLDGTTPSAPLNTPFDVIFITNFTPTQVTITAYVPNPNFETLSNIAVTYQLDVYTFIAPFVV